VIEFTTLDDDDLRTIARRAVAATEAAPDVTDEAIALIAGSACGDGRRAATLAELAVSTMPDPTGTLDEGHVATVLPTTLMSDFDTDGDRHYAYKSALQKSIRGSDPDAAVFWLMQLLEGGDILSPARRMLVMASEDVGMADPGAVSVVLSCVLAAERLGLPEARYPLTQAAVYLALAPKSNAIGKAHGAATADIHAGRGTRVPPHIASECAPGYQYPHDAPNHWLPQQYLPDDLVGRRYWIPGETRSEKARADYWNQVKNVRTRRG
jgi:putative ATPase